MSNFRFTNLTDSLLLERVETILIENICTILMKTILNQNDFHEIYDIHFLSFHMFLLVNTNQLILRNICAELKLRFTFISLETFI
jgi:hypothetical protein